MKKKAKVPLVICLFTAFICCFLTFCQPFTAEARIRSRKISLNDRLYLISLFQNSDFKQRFLKKVFLDRRLRKIPAVIKRIIYRVDSSKQYAGFHSDSSIKSAREFAETWSMDLELAEKRFGVDKEVLVSILLVETDLGNTLGKYPVISVFSSILLENYHKNYRLKSEYRNKSFLLKRLERKADMAIGELHAFLKLIEKSREDPFLYKGSFAGAFGVSQFLPSSCLRWGYDGDKNGRVNLFIFTDAIFSAANYLSAHGWKKGLKHKSNRKVIWKYNRSYVYVDNILKIAKTLASPAGKAEKTMDSKSIRVY